MSEFTGKKLFMIESRHVGLNVHTAAFVDWLSESLHEAEDEIERLKKEIERLKPKPEHVSSIVAPDEPWIKHISKWDDE